MTPKHLAISGFRSFRSDSIFPFATKAGFYLMTGENKKEPQLGANGVGKSTIWDALTWCLFGKTARGLRGNAVVNWEENNLTSVMFEFEVGKAKYQLTRTHGPNSLTLAKNEDEPEVITQEDVQALTKLDYTTFLYTVLMGQFNRFFFDLSATEKLAVFAEALGLDYWTKCSVKAAAEVKEQEKIISRKTETIARLQGTIDSLKPRVDQGKAASKQFESDKATKVQFIDNQLHAAKQQLDRFRKEMEGSRGDTSALEQKVRRYEKKLLRRDDKIKKQEQEIHQLNKVTSQFEVDYARHVKERKAVKRLSGKCPTCHQPIKDSHVKEVAGEMKLLVQWVEGEVMRARDAENAAKAKLDVYKERLREVNTKLTAAERALNEAKDKQGVAAGCYRAAQANVEGLSRQLADAKNLENQYVKQWECDRAALGAAFKAEEEQQQDLKIALGAFAQATFWAKGFKEIRLWIVDEALLELEIEVNNSLIELGLEGWNVKFDVERETTTGGITKGFTVNITSPDSHNPVPWEAWSGGETQRLRIAGAIGLSNLICNRLGVRPALEVFDEPTAHLSEEGIADLLTFFSARSRTEGKQIWLVDHRSLNFGSFDAEVRIIKDGSGSKVEGKRFEYNLPVKHGQSRKR